MGKRTSQATPQSAVPRARRRNRSLVGTLIRILAIVVAVLAVLFLVGGWYFSNEIRSGALEPPTTDDPDYPWTVTASDATIALAGSEDTDQAGEAGLSGIQWSDGYVQSSGLVSSGEQDGAWIDIRRLDSRGPGVDSDVKVDPYYYRGDPESTLGIPFEQVQYTSDVGSFPAWYVEGTTDTWAIVVHGKGGTPEEGLRALPTLVERGYHVLLIEYRNDLGQVQDPSGYYTYGETDWVDVAAAVTYANEHGATEHVLVGYSYGGSMIMSYLTQSPLRNFTTAVILDSPVTSFSDTVDFRASQTSLPLLPLNVPPALTSFAKWMAGWRFGIDWSATDYLEQTNDIHAPILVFHGTNDISVPYATSKELAELRPDIVTLFPTAAGHTRSWNVGPDTYDAAVNEFLDGLEG